MLSGNTSVGLPDSGNLGTLSIGNAIASELDYVLDLETSKDRYFVLENDAQRLFASSVQPFREVNGGFIDEYGNQVLVFKGTNTAIPIGEELVDYSERVRFHDPQNDISTRTTTKIDLTVNLTSNALPVTREFNRSDDSTFNYSFKAAAYDTLGQSHDLTFYFIFSSTGGEWLMYYNLQADNSSQGTGTATGPQLGGPYYLEFDTAGALISYPLIISTQMYTLNNGASSLEAIAVSLEDISQLAATYSNSIQQDGYQQGRMSVLLATACGAMVLSA